jgi:AcrR family transcriptional regulator
MNELIIANDINYLVFSEIYQRFTLPKTRRKAFAILEAAIECYDKRGFDVTTFKMVARQAGITAPALRRYFGDLDEIREFSVKYVHLTAQKIVVESMKGSGNPVEMLDRYLKAHLYWALHFKRHLCLWIGFISYSSRKKRDRAINTKAVLNGAIRISEILNQGRKLGVFNHKNDFLTARMIQTMILGWLTTLVTEDTEDIEAYSQEILNKCRTMVLKS